MSQVTPTAAISFTVRQIISDLVKEHGPVAVARGLFHAGCMLISHGQGRGEAQAELQRHLSKAYARAKAGRDIEDQPLAGVRADG